MSSHATSHVISMQEARRPRDQRFTMRIPGHASGLRAAGQAGEAGRRVPFAVGSPGNRAQPVAVLRSTPLTRQQPTRPTMRTLASARRIRFAQLWRPHRGEAARSVTHTLWITFPSFTVIHRHLKRGRHQQAATMRPFSFRDRTRSSLH